MLALYLATAVVGLALLARAADALVLGCSGLAARIGVPTVVVGVVVIGFGTSAPELLVSAIAAGSGSPALGVGTVIGSNIANLTLVLGAAALVAPLAVRAAVVRREAPLSLAASVAFALAVWFGMSRGAGVMLLVLLALALTFLVRAALRDQPSRSTVSPGGPATRDEGSPPEPGAQAAGIAEEVEELLAEQTAGPLRRVALQAAAGLLGTLLGAQALVWAAVGLARTASLSEGFIGASVVAVGTSLPELVTAAQASRRGEPDLVVGNLLGSNLFNALAVGGLVAVVSGGVTVGDGLRTAGLVVMLAVAALATLFMRRRFTVVRWEAATLIAVYVATLPLLAGG